MGLGRWFGSRRGGRHTTPAVASKVALLDAAPAAEPTAGDQPAPGHCPDGIADLVRYDLPLLADPALQDRLRTVGYAVLPPRIPADALSELNEIGLDFTRRLREPWGDLFLAVGRIADATLRQEVTDAAGDIVRPYLEPLFLPHVEVLGAPLQLKPPSPNSRLSRHQDASLLDEAVELGIYCWIPLVDVDEGNGWLEVVPGSHRLGNVQRTLNVPWQFDGQADVFRPHSVGLDLPAGSVCLFDAALVHGSPPNTSDEIRFAVNCFAKPKAAPMVHFFSDETTAPGQVEAWEIDVTFFLEENIMERPTERYRSLGERPHVRVAMTDEEPDRALFVLGEDARHYDRS